MSFLSSLLDAIEKGLADKQTDIPDSIIRTLMSQVSANFKLNGLSGWSLCPNWTFQNEQMKVKIIGFPTKEIIIMIDNQTINFDDLSRVVKKEFYEFLLSTATVIALSKIKKDFENASKATPDD